MFSSILPDNHYSLQITRQIKEIINPVKKEYGVDHFCLARYFNDGTILSLISNPDLYMHHFKNQYCISPIIPEKLLGKKFHYIVMPDLEDGFNQVAHEYIMYFNLSFPLYLFERSENYFDLYIFESHGNGAKSVNTYLNNFSLLENFKSYFKETAADLIAQSQNHKIILPESMRPNFGGLMETESPLPLVTSLPETIKNNFSKRKTEVIYYLLRGCSAKEIGIHLNLSHRTIEFHINEIKAKIGVKKKADLIGRVLNS